MHLSTIDGLLHNVSGRKSQFFDQLFAPKTKVMHLSAPPVVFLTGGCGFIVARLAGTTLDNMSYLTTG